MRVAGALILIALGLALATFCYSLRPPSGLGDVINIAVSGRGSYLKEPIYYSGLAVGGFLVLSGLVVAFGGRKRQ